MIGAIIGDIAGSTYEFNPTNDFNFPLFAPGSTFTDDTICTIAIADAFMREGDFARFLQVWCRKYPFPKGGYGASFAQWVRSENPEPYWSFGNGSAMRVSSIPWLCAGGRNVLYFAESSAKCTHDHPDGIDGAKFVAQSISLCLELPMNCRKAAVAMLANEYGFAGSYNLEDYRNVFDETCQGTIPAAVACILAASSFEEAIRYAVSLGADADTLGAIVGSIAEAIWGVPEVLKKKALALLPDEMVAIYNRFCELRHSF